MARHIDSGAELVDYSRRVREGRRRRSSRLHAAKPQPAANAQAILSLFDMTRGKAGPTPQASAYSGETGKRAAQLYAAITDQHWLPTSSLQAKEITSGMTQVRTSRVIAAAQSQSSRYRSLSLDGYVQLRVACRPWTLTVLYAVQDGAREGKVLTFVRAVQNMRSSIMTR